MSGGVRTWALAATLIGAMLALLLAPGQAAAAAPTGAPKRLALVIANGAYGQFERLAVTARDGERIASALTTTGFVDASGSGPVAVNRDLTLAQMLAKVRELREQLRAAGPSALGVFYFSGHGAALSSFGDMVMIPVDAGPELAADNARLTRAALVRELLGSGAQNILVVLDMCRNVIPAPAAFAAGTAIDAPERVDGVVSSKGLQRVVRAGAVSLRPDQGYLVAFSTSPDQVAFDNGTFSRVLAEEIRRPQQNVADAMKRTSDRVAVAAMREGAAFQKPTFDYGLQGAAPCFVSCSADAQDRFFDCANCPYMRAVPAGVATLGSPAGERGRGADEPAQRQVRVERPFAVGVFEVTTAEWAACVRDRACRPVADWGKENPNPLLPVTGVGYADAQAFVAWVSAQTGLAYRLPTEDEWEYAARAGGDTRFPWGDAITPSDANYDGTASYDGSPKSPYRGYPEAVAAYPPNSFGLYQMAGNAWEWTGGCADSACRARIARGGSFQSTPAELRVANRLSVRDGKRRSDLGLRVARDLAPDEMGR